MATYKREHSPGDLGSGERVNDHHGREHGAGQAGVMLGQWLRVYVYLIHMHERQRKRAGERTLTGNGVDF